MSEALGPTVWHFITDATDPDLEAVWPRWSRWEESCHNYVPPYVDVEDVEFIVKDSIRHGDISAYTLKSYDPEPLHCGK